MNDEFEKFLAKQPLRSIPPEWRAPILQSAAPQPVEETEPRGSWWRALIWPSPVAWACIGCAWVLIIGMNIASRPSAGEAPATSSSASSLDIFMAIRQERQLVREFSQPEEEPAEPPRKRDPSGAFNGRRYARRDSETA